MFPIRDHNPSGRTPYVTYMLIAANVLIFLSYVGNMTDIRAMNALWINWAMIPARIAEGEGLHTLFTSMFLHGGVMHLAGNMLFLYIFGDNVEDAFGRRKFLLLYLASGLCASLTQFILEPASSVPMVGASGAIAGVMGAYLLLFPRARVDILIIIIVIFRVLPIPAWILLAVWFGMQFLGGISSNAFEGGVAYWAHAGGFVAGLVLTIAKMLEFAVRHDIRPVIETYRLDQVNEAMDRLRSGQARYRIVQSRIPKVGRR